MSLPVTGSVTAVINELETNISGVLSAVTQSIYFYFGRKYLTNSKPSPCIIWEPDTTRIYEPKGTLGREPRQLFTEEFGFIAHIFDNDFESTDSLKDIVANAIRQTAFFGNGNGARAEVEGVRVFNPNFDEKGWRQDLKFSFKKVIAQNPPYTFATVYSASIEESGSLNSGSIFVPSQSLFPPYNDIDD